MNQYFYWAAVQHALTSAQREHTKQGDRKTIRPARLWRQVASKKKKKVVKK